MKPCFVLGEQEPIAAASRLTAAPRSIKSPPSMPIPCGSPRPNASIVPPGQLIGGGADPRGWKPHAIRGPALPVPEALRVAASRLRTVRRFSINTPARPSIARALIRMRCRLLLPSASTDRSPTCLRPALPTPFCVPTSPHPFVCARTRTAPCFFARRTVPAQRSASKELRFGNNGPATGCPRCFQNGRCAF